MSDKDMSCKLWNADKKKHFMTLIMYESINYRLMYALNNIKL